MNNKNLMARGAVALVAIVGLSAAIACSNSAAGGAGAGGKNPLGTHTSSTTTTGASSSGTASSSSGTTGADGGDAGNPCLGAVVNTCAAASGDGNCSLSAISIAYTGTDWTAAGWDGGASSLPAP
jgi:hypothetical protein